jgi:hypothetical protein
VVEKFTNMTIHLLLIHAFRTYYRCFVKWINAFATLGKDNRVVIPACAVGAIRAQWPEESGEYVGFLPSAEDFPS